MNFIPRRVRPVSLKEQSSFLQQEPVGVEVLRDKHAWALLGEPGAGKSTVFEQEAKATNGICIPIRQFISGKVNESLRGKILFLDGMDEVRRDDGVLLDVASRLRELETPAFRIACRAADWFGQSDIKDLSGASAISSLEVYVLEPLQDEDIQQIVSAMLKEKIEQQANTADGVSEPSHPYLGAALFLMQARQHGLGEWLRNPQALSLIVEGFYSTDSPKGQGELGATWLSTRSGIYQKACEAMVAEQNKRHRDLARTQTDKPSSERLLTAAGKLFATLLLSDKSGIALDASAASDFFVPDHKFQENCGQDAGISASNIQYVLKTKLFMPSQKHQEQLEPLHRTVAEYLAANWLHQQLTQGLSWRRLRELLLGFDGRVVSSLRGLAGWLASKNKQVRDWLILNDPLCALCNTDLADINVADKHSLMRSTKAKIRDDLGFRSEISDLSYLPSLYQADLNADYLAALQDSARDDTTQVYTLFILTILASAPTLFFDQLTLRDVAADASRWRSVRSCALDAWIRSGIAVNDVKQFLDDCQSGKIDDPEDFLSGLLLQFAFPGWLSALDTLSYLRVPQSVDSLDYLCFWRDAFPDNVEDEDLPAVLDALVECQDSEGLNWQQDEFADMLCHLLARAIDIHGDVIDDAQLLSWLSLGVDECGGRPSDQDRDNYLGQIQQWLSSRPTRFKGLLGTYLDDKQNQALPADPLCKINAILCYVSPPDDISIWHFQRLNETEIEDLMKFHLTQAMRSLGCDSKNHSFLLDDVWRWASDSSKKMALLEPLLFCDVAWLIKSKSNQLKHQQLLEANKRQRTIKLANYIEDIRAGTASAAVMNELAKIWLGEYSNVPGDKPHERFNNYCGNAGEVLDALKIGMVACLVRSDLPDHQSIVDLHLQGRSHALSRPCLLGMEWLYEQDPREIEKLSSTTVDTVLSMWLTHDSCLTTRNPPDWFNFLLTKDVNLVADVLVRCISACIKAKKMPIHHIGLLSRAYDSYVKFAQLTLPNLIEVFPTRIPSGQLDLLAYLLCLALKYRIPELASLISNKTKLKSLDPAQKIYFLFVQMSLDPARYEQALWDFVVPSWKNVEHLLDIVGFCFSRVPNLIHHLSAKFYGRLIEIVVSHADFDGDLLGDYVEYKRRLTVGNLIAFFKRLAPSEASLQELDRLLSLPDLIKIHDRLLQAKQTLTNELRERSYRHPPLDTVFKILGKLAPTSPRDLQAIVMDSLEIIEKDIQTSNSNIYEFFWTQDKKNNSHKDENNCRNVLSVLLKSKLQALSFDWQPESLCVANKRVDILVAYRIPPNQYEVPIEIKGEWHDKLWTAAKEQLPQYTQGQATQGYGIYLVLWVGGKDQPTPSDGGKKPTSPKELEQRLMDYLPPDQQKLTAVKVLDVSWRGAKR